MQYSLANSERQEYRPKCRRSLNIVSLIDLWIIYGKYAGVYVSLLAHTSIIIYLTGKKIKYCLTM